MNFGASNDKYFLIKNKVPNAKKIRSMFFADPKFDLQTFASAILVPKMVENLICPRSSDHTRIRQNDIFPNVS